MDKHVTWMKKFAIVLLAMAMLVSLCACGSGQDANATPAEVIKAAQEKMAEVTSMSYDMIMDMEMGIAEQSFVMNTTATADQIVEPLQMKMEMSMNMGELGTTATTMYIAQEDGKFMCYMGMDDGTGNMIWQKQEMTDVDEIMAQYDGKESMDVYISSAEGFVENGSEEINGEEATRYDGTISKDAMNEALETSGALSQFSSLGLSEDALASMINDLGEMPISIWIGTDSGLPVKYDMDMTTVMQNLMTNMMDSMGGSADMELTISKMTISMTLRNFNGVEAIEIPAEAQAAQAL